MKKLISFTIASAILATSILPTTAAAASNYDYNVRVLVNKELVQSDVRPFIDTTNSRTYVPIRFVSQALGEKVSWDNKSKTVTVQTRSKRVIKLTRGQKSATVNGVKISIDASAIEKNGRVLVPIRFVSEQMKATVDSKKANGWTSVNISYAAAPKPDKGNENEQEKPNKYYSKFELDKKYNKLAPYLFKENLRVENGELVFKVPNIKLASATHMGVRGKMTELQTGKEYRYKLGQDGYVGFFLIHEDSSVEGYYVYLSANNSDLMGDFKEVKGDAIVVNNLRTKETASTLSEVLNMYR